MTAARPSLRFASIWIAVVSLGLLGWVLATGIGVGAVILVAPAIAAWIGWTAPRSRGLLLIADVLLGTTVVLLLIGLIGLLYLPPLILFVAATVAPQPRSSGQAEGVR